MSKKVGSYAVTSIDFNAWFGEEHNVKVLPKNKKQKNKKKIIYPIFLDFANYSTDIFWVKKFNLWANGKIPKYFTIGDKVIYYNKSNHIIECILNQDIETNTKNCVLFFKTYGGIFSKNDEQEEEEELSSEVFSDMTEPEPKTWSQWDKKSQELMIKNYTNDLIEMMNLNQKESNLLLQTLKLSISAKNFNKSHIVIEKGKIISVKGLLWDKTTKMFKIEYCNASSKPIYKKYDDSENSEDDLYISDMTKDMIPQFNQKIKKYYELYDKKYKKYTL